MNLNSTLERNQWWWEKVERFSGQVDTFVWLIAPMMAHKRNLPRECYGITRLLYILDRTKKRLEKRNEKQLPFMYQGIKSWHWEKILFFLLLMYLLLVHVIEKNIWKWWKTTGENFHPWLVSSVIIERTIDIGSTENDDPLSFLYRCSPHFG